MEISSIEWIGGGYDLHLITGKTIELLKIHFVDGTSKRVSELVPEDKVKVTFRPMIKHVLNDEDVRDFGIVFEMKTGILTINDSLPNETGKRLYNFIIEATVENLNSSNSEPITSATRIHVHDEIIDAWLTPSKMSIRHGSDGFRFSILATFLDNVNGSLFQTPGDISRFTDFSDFNWKSSDELKVKIDNVGNLSTVVSNASDVEITAVLPSIYFGNNVPEPRRAKVDVLPSWSNLPTQVRLVGRKDISQEEIEKYPNLLFIAEGFTDQSTFENEVDRLVEEIKVHHTLMPFNILSLSHRINYWSIFIPSNDDITSPLHLLHPVATDEGASETLIKNEDCYAVKPDPDNLDNEWTLQELIYTVGLPLLSDFFISDNVNEDYRKKTEQWEKLFVNSPLTLDILRTKKAPLDLWWQWRVLGIYYLANETDTALGISNGSRPNVDLNPNSTSDIISWHPFRTKRAHLDQFLEKLKTPSGFPIGERWTSNSSIDRECIVILCHQSDGLGTAGDSIRVSLFNTSAFQVENLNSQINIFGGFSIISYLETANTICHEFAHILGLGNESGGLDSMPDSFASGTRDICNVQSHSELLDSSGGIIGISGRDIKWNWPRITKAGILKEYLPDTSTNLKIRLDNDYKPFYKKDYFNTNNKVRFRQRVLPRVETSMQEFDISSIESSPDGDILTLKPTNSEEFNKLDFPLGSLVIVTRPDTLEFPDDRPYQRIIHKSVLNQINVSKRPLTAPPPSSSSIITHDCVTVLRAKSPRPAATETQYPKNIPSLRNPKSRNRCMIIGVYEGGEDYECNVYHPIGHCIMRTSGHTGFCHVCRYFIVDKLYPPFHREIDRIYENNYPNR